MESTTITLKNVPLELHHSLKESAKRNKRSLNQEAIHFLEAALLRNPQGGKSLRQAPAPARVGKFLISEECLTARADDLMDRGE